MTHKKIVSLALVALMLFGVASVLPVNASFPANSIWVEPQTYNATVEGKTIGDTFTVSVWINVSDVNGLYGLEYKLKWDPTLLNHVSHTMYLPWTPNFVAKDQVTSGQYWFGASALAPASPYNGQMKVLDITFEIIYQPYYPEPDASCALDLADTKMGNPSAQPILHTAYDGQYIIETITPPAPALRVNPAEYNAETAGKNVGDTFDIDIEIVGLAAAWDLYGWEVKLGYNPLLIKVDNVVSGGFLQSFAGPYGTFFTYRDRPEYNYVVMAELFLGTGNEQPYGTGKLATVTFEIIYEEAYPNQAVCALDLFDVKLVSSQMTPIEVPPQNISDGVYRSPMSTPPGASIDVYTENWRWPGYTTTNTGEVGKDTFPADADAVAPQEEITLYAKLTYGGAPVQYKEVAWEITAPTGEKYYRQSMTDNKGLTSITIRMPWYEIYFGEWTVLAKASVAETPVQDIVTFELGYIVEVVDSVTISPVNRGETVSVTLTITNIGSISRDVFITITVYDDVGMPVATFSKTETILPGTHTYGPYTMTIAEWAHVGKGTVYINLLTAQPSQCGTCYAPEHVQEFTITFIDP